MDKPNPYRSPEHMATEAAASSPGGHFQDGTRPGRWQGTDLVLALVQQAVLLVVTALLLDGGFLFRICCVAAIAHWIAVVIVRIRRPAVPTALDAGVVKFGFPFCFLLAYSGAFVVLTLRALR